LFLGTTENEAGILDGETSMRIAQHLGLALICAVILAGGCGPSVELTSVYGPGVRFADNARLYAWAPGSSRTAGAGRPQNADADKLIREFIDAHLARKGYQKVAEDGKPDFWIDYAVGKSLRGDPNDFTKPMYKEGRIEVSAINPANSKLIWRGGGETRLDEGTPPDESRKRLDMVIGKVIDQAPTARQKL
jgi:hypothetical protein